MMTLFLAKIEAWEIGLGDKGYEGTRLIIPPFKGPNLSYHQRFNKKVNRKRQLIERVNKRIKDFQILYQRFRHPFWLQSIVFNVCLQITNIKLEFHPLLI
jgi:hypothetical protein